MIPQLMGKDDNHLATCKYACGARIFSPFIEVET
jgi:hypothetical protein